jgi:malate synthase
MWAVPDEMAEMMKAKAGHVKSGASTAWVPSPTAATLHALHYHTHSVAEAQAKVLGPNAASGAVGAVAMPGRDVLDAILTVPVMGKAKQEAYLKALKAQPVDEEGDDSGAAELRAELQDELRSNAQSILGYVVRWVDSGVGCSKVLNLSDKGKGQGGEGGEGED